MKYLFIFCDDQRAAAEREAELEEEARLDGKNISIKKVSIGKVKKVSFEFAKMNGSVLEVDKQYPSTFKPSGDEVLLQVIIGDEAKK